jgi:uncharacterized caspase-like protein
MATNWAIVIGINQYRFLQPLQYAKRDAEAMQRFLMQDAKFDRIFLFTDDSPSVGGKSTEPFRANLLRVLRQIFEKPFMQDGDNFWFFFSGHGIPYNGQDYLMPLDGDPEDIENTGISTNTITNYLRSCGADNAVMILDACRSGGKKSGEGIGRQTEAEARQTGVISLFSCSPDQYSYELEAIEQGAFTYALLEGLGIRGRCATVERLNQYLEHRVPELVSQHLGRVRQMPYTIAEPLNRSHLILMPRHASLADIATLKNDAYRAERKQNWDLAQRLWIRVLAAASGQDMEAIEALQNLGIHRFTRATSPQVEQNQSGKSSEFSEVSTKANTLSSNQRSPLRRIMRSLILSLPFGEFTWELYNILSDYFARRLSEIFASSNRIDNNSRPSHVSLDPLARRQFLKWAIPAGVGVVGVTVASQFIKESPQPTSPSSSSVPSSSSSSSPSSTSVDYSRLEGFLQAGKWKEANQETSSLLLRITNRETYGWLDARDIQNLPCEVLSKIDRLWVDNSKGQFGFSVQKQIYLESCGGKADGQYDDKAWRCFVEQVRWRVKNEWIS